MKRATVFGHWEGTFVLANGILLKYAFFYLNTFPAIGGSAGWMTAILVSALFFGIAFLCGQLYPKKRNIDLLDMAQNVFGSRGQKVLGILLMVCFLAHAAVNLLFFAESFRNSLLVNQSSKLLVYLLIGAAFFLALQGLECIVRVHSFFVPITLLVTGVIALFLSLEGDIYNLFPIFGTGAPQVFGKGLMAMSGFFEFVFLFLISPYLKTYSCFSKTLKLTVCITSVATIVLTFAYLIAVPYPANTNILSVIMMTPDYMTFHYIPQELFTIFSIFYCVCTALYISIHLQACAEIFAKMYSLKKTNPLIIGLAVLLAGVTQIPENLEQVQRIYDIGIRFLWIPGLVVPAAVLWCYGRKEKKNETQK